MWWHFARVLGHSCGSPRLVASTHVRRRRVVKSSNQIE